MPEPLQNGFASVGFILDSKEVRSGDGLHCRPLSTPRTKLPGCGWTPPLQTSPPESPRLAGRAELLEVLQWHQQQIVKQVVEQMAAKLTELLQTGSLYASGYTSGSLHSQSFYTNVVAQQDSDAVLATPEEPPVQRWSHQRRSSKCSHDTQRSYLTVDQERSRIVRDVTGSQISMQDSPGSRHSVTSNFLKDLASMQRLRRKTMKLVNGSFFELVVACVILSDALMIGVEVEITSHNDSSRSPTVFIVIQSTFTCFYLVELMLRFSGNTLRGFFCRSKDRSWNCFDFFVCCCSVGEVLVNVLISDDTMGNLPQLVQLARIVRLIRVLRIARVVRFVAGLKIMIISILSTLKALGWALILLLVIMYCYGIVLAGAVTSHFEALSADGKAIPDKDRLEKYWGSLRAAMYTLFMSISGGLSWIDAVMPLGDVGWIWGAIFTSFISFAYFAVLNVMTGVFCQSALDTAAKNQDLKWHGMLANKQHFVEKIQSFFMQIDSKNAGQLDYKQMIKCWDSQDMQSFFASLDIEPDDAWMFFQILDTDGEHGVSMDEFVEGCMRLKGQAKAFDVAVMTYHQKHLGRQLVDFMNEVQAKLRYFNGTIAESNAPSRLDTDFQSQSLALASSTVPEKDFIPASPYISETASPSENPSSQNWSRLSEPPSGEKRTEQIV